MALYTLPNIQSFGGVRGGLESVSLKTGLTEAQWSGGVTHRGLCDIVPRVWHCDSNNRVEGGDEKVVSSGLTSVEFDSTQLYVIAECPGLDAAASNQVVFESESALIRGRWGSAASLLMTGDIGLVSPAVNPGLIDAAIVPASLDNADPSNILNTLQGLLDYSCTCFGDGAVLHVPQQFLPYFLALQIMTWDGTNYWIGANIKVSFDCYPNVEPSIGDYTTAIDGSEVWLYITRAPIVEFGALHATDGNRHVLNKFQHRLEQGLIVAFDPCCVIAAKAQVC